MARVATSLAPFGIGTGSEGIADITGLQVVMDFYTYMAKIGAAYQVRAGTITTPLVGDVVLTDAAAEYSVDALLGTTLIPVFQNISLRLMATLALEMATKSVGAVSTAGTAFVPLALLPGGAAAVSTARVSAAGGVTVTAELATTTRRHWSYSNPTGNTTAGTNLGIYAFPPLEWSPRALAAPLFLKGPACLYTQIAAATTGPSFFANLDYLEGPTATLLG